MEAVLVIDAQRGIFEGSEPPDDGPGTLRRINEVLARARAAGRPAIFLQHEEAPDLVRGAPGWELHPSLDRLPSDPVVRKAECDGFRGTSLDEELGRWAAKTLVVMGCATEFCVDSTVRAAASRGYHVVVVSDGHTTADRPPLAAAHIRALHNWVWPRLAATPPVTVMPASAVHFGT
ncbi:MAG: isochorismatase family protein [Opitutaceae bacterium]